MTRLRSLLLTMTARTLPIAHAHDASDEPFAAGKPLASSSNARTYGGFHFAERSARGASSRTD